jgi:hypothetical protein
MSSSNNEVGGNHYKKLKISPVEYIRANNLDFFEGNVIKYVTRHRRKNGAEDILKAVDYLRMILKDEYGLVVKFTQERPKKSWAHKLSSVIFNRFKTQANGFKWKVLDN